MVSSDCRKSVRSAAGKRRLVLPGTVQLVRHPPPGTPERPCRAAVTTVSGPACHGDPRRWRHREGTRCRNRSAATSSNLSVGVDVFNPHASSTFQPVGGKYMAAEYEPEDDERASSSKQTVDRGVRGQIGQVAYYRRQSGIAGMCLT